MSKGTNVLLGAMMAFVLLAAACGGKVKDESAPSPPARAGEPPEEARNEASPQQLRGCLEALDAMGGAVPDWQTILLAKGCPHACPEGLRVVAEARAPAELPLLIESCDFFCNGEMKKNVGGARPPTRLPLAVEACGLDHYGLPEGQESMLSLEWFVAQRVGRWLADARKQYASSHAQLVAELDEVLVELRIPIALPAMMRGTYELPRATHTARLLSQTYVVVSADRVTAAATPVALLTQDGARLADDAGGLFPGTPVDLPGLPAEIARLEALSPVREVRPSYYAPGEEPEPDDEEAEPELVRNPILGPDELARFDGAGEDLEAAVTPGRHQPVVLADAKLPATRLLEVIAALGWSGGSLGVSQENGTVASLRLGIAAARVPATGFVPRVLLFVDNEGFTLTGTAAVLRKIPKTGSGYDFDGLFATLRQLADPGMPPFSELRGIFLSVDETATTQDLATTVEVAAAARFNWVRATPAPVAQSWIKQAASVRSPAIGAAKPRAQARIDKVTAVGGLKKSIIRRYVRRKLSRIKYCYEQELHKDPKLAGTVVVTFEILPSGAVRDLVAEGVHEKVSECAGQLIEAIRFPEHKGDGVAKVQFSFELKLW